MTTIYLTSGSTFTKPADWNNGNNTVECIGAGGGGCQYGQQLPSGNFYGGSGGGGGGYAKSVNVVISGATCPYVIGIGGGNSTPGGATSFNGTCNANGGAQGVWTSNGGAGGSGTSGNSVNRTGGTGGVSTWATGGGGGGAAGPNGNGVSAAATNNSATGTAGGAANGGTVAGGAAGGNGGGNGSTDGVFGSGYGCGSGGGGGGGAPSYTVGTAGNGGSFGGGGGGAGDAGSGGAGAGQNGLIVINYVPLRTTSVNLAMMGL